MWNVAELQCVFTMSYGNTQKAHLLLKPHVGSILLKNATRWRKNYILVIQVLHSIVLLHYHIFQYKTWCNFLLVHVFFIWPSYVCATSNWEYCWKNWLTKTQKIERMIWTYKIVTYFYYISHFDFKMFSIILFDWFRKKNITRVVREESRRTWVTRVWKTRYNWSYIYAVRADSELTYCMWDEKVWTWTAYSWPCV